MPRMLERDMDTAGAARFLLDSVGSPEPPVCPFELAADWGMIVAWTTGPSRTAGGVILVHRHDEPERRRWDCAHELGHMIAGHVGLPPKSESVANAIASATLVPDRAFKRDLSRHAWDLAELVPRYQVSWEVLARRVPKVVSSVSTIVDNGRVWYRERSRWLTSAGGPHPRRLEPWEDRLVVQAAGSGRHVYAANLVTAFSVPSPGWDRVVLVSGIEEWEALTWAAMAAE